MSQLIVQLNFTNHDHWKLDAGENDAHNWDEIDENKDGYVVANDI